MTHTITTTRISCCAARHMGLSGEQIHNIYYGALLHDLGKIGIPVEILEYPGRLSSQAMAIMRTHVGPDRKDSRRHYRRKDHADRASAS